MKTVYRVEVLVYEIEVDEEGQEQGDPIFEEVVSEHEDMGEALERAKVLHEKNKS